MKKRLITSYTLGLLSAGILLLGTSESEAKSSTGELTKPTAQWTLPAELREVSGIAWLGNNLMACVQDEEGVIFIYDLEKKAIKEKISFAGPGDYEGIVVNGNTAYILRSDGAILEVEDYMNQKKVNVHATVLASTQNTEGLAFDKKNNRLLIACKGYDEALGDTKGIYAFSLDNKTMQEKPVISIPLAQQQLTATEKKKKSKYDVLQPSSLEVHPKTGELYLLDAVNNKLLILDEQGKIGKATSLDKSIFKQAEGLSFGDDGALYIASEGGKKGNGVLVKYDQGLK